MLFWISLGATVELRTSSGANLDWKLCLFQLFKQVPSSCINRCSILEWSFCQAQNLIQQFGLILQENPNVFCSFLVIASLASQCQVTDPVGTTIGFGLDMFDLQRNILGAAVGTCTSPFFELIFPDFEALQSPLLVFDVGNLRIFHLLHIETHQFHGNRSDRCELLKPVNPGYDRKRPVQQRWRQPAFWLNSVRQPWFSISGFSTSPAVANIFPGKQRCADCQAAVRKHHREDDLLGNFVCQGKTGFFGAWIDLLPDRLNIAISTILQMIVNGNLRSTAALPLLRSFLALAGEVSTKGFLVLLTTNTPFMPTSF